MMPYITAFFMPRQKETGRMSFRMAASISHFSDSLQIRREIPYLRTEYSVRTAMEAVYGLLGVDRGVPEVWGQCV